VPIAPGAPADPARAAATGARSQRRSCARLAGQADPTHSSEPSAKYWCFHTGSRALTVSTSRAHVSNAAARVVGGDRCHQGRVTDLQRAYAVADRNGPHAVTVRRDLGGDVGERSDVLKGARNTPAG